MANEDWVKFGAVRGLIGVLLAAIILLMSYQGALSTSTLFVGSIIAILLVAGLYAIYAYALGETLRSENIKGWSALAVIASLVGITSAIIILLVSYTPAMLSAPGTAVASGQSLVLSENASSASVTVTQTPDFLTALWTSWVGELLVASFTGMLYSALGYRLPEP